MSLEVEAVYENGVLRPDVPLPLDEHERVTVQVLPHSNLLWTRAKSLQWTGDPAVLRQIAEGELGGSEQP